MKKFMKALILARVSTKEQMEEGQSIPSQVRRMREYCEYRNLLVDEVFEITESSTKDVRNEFSSIIEIIKKSKEPIALITDTIDRLQRGFKESVILDDFRKQEKLELHFLRENLILNKDSNSADLLRWDMGVMFARSYVLQLGDNVKRSLREKLNNGELPGKAHIGYKNITLSDGKKDIVIDEERSHYILKAFELYAAGGYSAKSLAKEMNKRGLTNYPSNKPVTASQIHKILKDSFYHGEMLYNGKIYKHRYDTVVPRHLFEKVQKVIAGYNKQNYKRTNKPYIFRGLVKCAECGCAISPEIKKGKYIYYHCTNYHGNCTNVVWIREKDLILQIKQEFQNMKLTKKSLDKLTTEMRRIHDSEQEYFIQNKNTLEHKLSKIRNRYKVMYEDRLDGRITTEDYDKRCNDYKLQEQDLMEQLEDHSKANQNFYITAGTIIDLSQKSWEIFQVAEPEEKTQLINFVFQNFSLQGKILVFETKNPFAGVIAYQKTGKLLHVMEEVRTLLKK
ncbi:MAG: recombinase family protein [Parcubacteria group bacterium]|jgi:DNA invertase Pin-like site-specific DNA recombinase